jgi:hypothetical protein
MGKCRKDWSAPNCARFVHCYIKTRLHRRTRHTFPDQADNDFGCGLERLPMQGFEVAGGQRSFHRKVNGANLNIKQTAMFSYDVEVMEGPERGVPLTVRLERQQLRAIFVGQVPQQWRTPVPDESFLAIGNWEINAAIGRPCRRTSAIARMSRLLRIVLIYDPASTLKAIGSISFSNATIGLCVAGGGTSRISIVTLASIHASSLWSSKGS